MKPVYIDSQIPEHEAKKRYHFPENIMMENAAAALEQKVYEVAVSHSELKLSELKILIICGTGNNGGDGLALARRLHGELNCQLYLTGAPKTEEAKIQLQMANAVGVNILTKLPENLNSFSIIVDCILGTGFYGDLRNDIAEIVAKVNSSNAKIIACDIPTGIQVKADFTVTMGALKSILFTDKAKQMCGIISSCKLGISDNKFMECAKPDAFKICKTDIKLPLRKSPAAHKGTFGHTAVFAGEKSGASIIAATAALNFGSGLVTLVKTEKSNLEQFKISPEIMINSSIPENTTCVAIGSGLGIPDSQTLNCFCNWFKNAKHPACVIDADLLNFNGIADLLNELNKVNEAKIILTPHPKELKTLCEFLFPDDEEIKQKTVIQISEDRLQLGRRISERFENVTVVMKSANTFISSKNNTFIITKGTQSLAKAGSGDVLAGLNAALLAQKYSSKDAAITATYVHGAASKAFDNGESYSLTPEKLIEKIAGFCNQD